MTQRSGILTGTAVWILLFIAPAVSRADIDLFTNFGPGFSYNTGAGNFAGNAFDGSGNNYAEGDTFTPTTSANFSALDIALSCFFSCPDPVTVSLDANNAGVPGAVLESFNVLGPLLGAFGSNNSPLVLTSVLHPLLVAGTQYWVAVSTDLNDSVVWNWNSTGDASSEAISTNGGTTWFAPSGLTPGAYQVNATPEPRAVVLLATVVLVLLGWKRRALASASVRRPVASIDLRVGWRYYRAGYPEAVLDS
jgi:hypothetical protein